MDITKISINGTEIPKPVNFVTEREDVYAGEYTTCTGKTIADRIGWRYADAKMKWEALCQDDFNVLVNMSGESTFRFHDESNAEVTEKIFRITSVGARRRYTVFGKIWWEDVEIGVRFINVHS